MRKRSLSLVIMISLGVLLTGRAFQIRPGETLAPNNPAKVSLEVPAKAKRGKTVTLQVIVDMTGVTSPGTSQPAALGSYVIPISFDRSLFEFVSAGGGETAAFGSGPASITNAQSANVSGVVTLLGSQTASDTTTGVVRVANVTFRVVAEKKGKSTLSVNAELGTPGLSLASPTGSAMPSAPYRIAAVGQSDTLKIK
jgi:hypothetical protein